MSRIDDMIARLCPDGVEYKALGEIGEISGGGTPSKDVAAYWDGDIPWVSVKDMQGQLYLTDTQDHISSAGSRSKSNILKPAGALIIATRMAVGRVAIITKEMAINQDLKAIKLAKCLDSKFALYALLNLKIQGTTASTVSGISQDELKRIRIRFRRLRCSGR